MADHRMPSSGKLLEYVFVGIGLILVGAVRLDNWIASRRDRKQRPKLSQRLAAEYERAEIGDPGE